MYMFLFDKLKTASGQGVMCPDNLQRLDFMHWIAPTNNLHCENNSLHMYIAKDSKNIACNVIQINYRLKLSVLNNTQHTSRM